MAAGNGGSRHVFAFGGPPSPPRFKREREEDCFSLGTDWDGIMRSAPMPRTTPSMDEVSEGSSRRNAHYRSPPKQFHNRSAPRSKGKPQPLFGFGDGVGLASSSVSGSFLRIGNQAAATSFAAAISPRTRRKKESFQKPKLTASSPLLGPPKESTMGNCTSRKSPPRGSLSSAIKAPLRSVSKTAKRVAALPSKVASRKKRMSSRAKQDLGMAPPLCKYETMDETTMECSKDSSDNLRGTSKNSCRSPSPLFDEEVKFAPHLEALEPERKNDDHLEKAGFSPDHAPCFSLGSVLTPCSTTDSSFKRHLEGGIASSPQPQDVNSSLFVECGSLASVSPLGMQDDSTMEAYRTDEATANTEQSIHFLFDKLRMPTDMTNMFLDAQGRQEGVASPMTLSPSRSTVNLFENFGESKTRDVDGASPTAQEPQAPNQQDDNRKRFEEALDRVMSEREVDKDSNPAAFYEPEVHESVSDVHGKLPHSNSCHSIPSVISTEEGLIVDQSDILDDSMDAVANVDGSFVFGDMPPVQVPQGAAEKKDAADSALAWSALSMILGSPAPTSVKNKKKRRQPVNLWLDDGDSDVDLLDDIMLPPQDDNESGGNMPTIEYDADAEDDYSIPSMSPEGAQEEQEEAVPDLDCVVPNLDDAYEQPLSLFDPTASNNSKKDMADSTLAWTALAAILGSPAPSSLVKKSDTKSKVNLWEDGQVTDLLPEIGEEEDAASSDAESSVSVPTLELDEPVSLDELPDTDVATGLPMAQGENAKKKSADSVLAWGALGMLLGAPAPQAVSKQSRKSTAKNLWDDSDGASADDLDDLLPFEPEAEDHSQGVPSLSGTFTDDEDDANSIPSLFGISDEDSGPSSSPLTLSAGDLIPTSPKRVSNSKNEAADSVLAWSALGMLLGSPAPKSASPRRKREPHDLAKEFKAFSLEDNPASDDMEPPIIDRRPSSLTCFE